MKALFITLFFLFIANPAVAQDANQPARELGFTLAAYPHSPELGIAILFPERLLGFNWVGIAYEWGQMSVSVSSV